MQFCPDLDSYLASHFYPRCIFWPTLLHSGSVYICTRPCLDCPVLTRKPAMQHFPLSLTQSLTNGVEGWVESWASVGTNGPQIYRCFIETKKTGWWSHLSTVMSVNWGPEKIENSAELLCLLREQSKIWRVCEFLCLVWWMRHRPRQTVTDRQWQAISQSRLPQGRSNLCGHESERCSPLKGGGVRYMRTGGEITNWCVCVTNVCVSLLSLLLIISLSQFMMVGVVCLLSVCTFNVLPPFLPGLPMTLVLRSLMMRICLKSQTTVE